MDIRKIEQALLLSFGMLVVVPLLYMFRFADHSAFTSWQWVFSGPGVARTFLLLIPALACAYLCSRLSLSRSKKIIFLFFLSLAAVVPLWSEPESILDASRYFVQAKSLKEYGVSFFLKEWGRSIPAWTDLPLAPFLDGLLFARIGEARVVIQAFNSLLFAFTVVLTFLIGKKLWDEETGLQTGILLIGTPYLLTQVPLLLVDVPTMFFLTLAVYTFLQALDCGGFAWTAASAAAICAAFFSKYSAWPMLLLIPLIAAVRSQRDEQETLVRAFAVLGISMALCTIVIGLRFDFLREQLVLLWTFQRPGLGRWHEGFISTFLFQTHPFITGFALMGMYQALKKRDRTCIIPAWFFVMTALFRIDRIRYLLPLLPLFVLMASYGLNVVKDQRAKRFISLSIAATAIVIAWGAYLPFLAKTSPANLMEAGRYLDSLNCDAAEVYALPQKNSTGSTFAALPLLDYSTGAKIVSPQDWPGLGGNREKELSSMRFTWEMKKPAFYAKRDDGNARIVVLLSDEVLKQNPPAYRGWNKKVFSQQSDQFKFQTVVTVFTPSHLTRINRESCLAQSRRDAK